MDIQRFANDIREYARYASQAITFISQSADDSRSRSRKDWEYELLHDIFEQVQLSDWYSDEQRSKLCLELLDMSM